MKRFRARSLHLYLEREENPSSRFRSALTSDTKGSSVESVKGGTLRSTRIVFRAEFLLFNLVLALQPRL
jgi:hypothetical protein